MSVWDGKYRSNLIKGELNWAENEKKLFEYLEWKSENQSVCNVEFTTLRYGKKGETKHKKWILSFPLGIRFYGRRK